LALARLRQRAESFGSGEPPHYVFAAFVPKFTFNGKRVVVPFANHRQILGSES
jgi:hypothetical protein